MRDEAELEDEMRESYDASILRDGVRGKYFERFRAGTNVVILEPDVYAVFRDGKAVNEALRLLIRLARTATPDSDTTSTLSAEK
jgi:hypothetical protein